MEQELLSARRSQLVKIIRDSFQNCEPHSQAFALRILGAEYESEIMWQLDVDSMLSGVAYGGYPEIASLGFALGADHALNFDYESPFWAGVNRLRQRVEKGLVALSADDVAILGIADGLSRTTLERYGNEVTAAKTWLVQIIDRTAKRELWLSRMRDLAGDLLDSKGRLRVSPNSQDTDTNALEIVLRSVWPNQFSQTSIPSRKSQREILKALLVAHAPQDGDLEQVVVWLRAIDLLVDHACEALLPSLSDVSRILRSTQHAFKRWVWEDKPSRRNSVPAKWLIDREAHVQSFLWALLYPIYGSELVDETYLPSWGNAQPRFDLGIVKLKLIIEVKYARQPSDFKDIEEQVAGDLGLYFKDTNMFDRMIVFIYDDCDHHRPESYDSLRNALMARERIEDVIILRRPGMIPPRNQRSTI